MLLTQLLNCAPHSLPLTIALILLCQVVQLEQERKTEAKLAKKNAKAVEISPAASGREAPCARVEVHAAGWRGYAWCGAARIVAGTRVEATLPGSLRLSFNVLGLPVCP